MLSLYFSKSSARAKHFAESCDPIPTRTIRVSLGIDFFSTAFMYCCATSQALKSPKCDRQTSIELPSIPTIAPNLTSSPMTVRTLLSVIQENVWSSEIGAMERSSIPSSISSIPVESDNNSSSSILTFADMFSISSFLSSFIFISIERFSSVHSSISGTSTSSTITDSSSIFMAISLLLLTSRKIFVSTILEFSSILFSAPNCSAFLSILILSSNSFS
mmetsp:Transcript_18817/g.24431  ORF Transcript_18817/g.24431 Transcript_18817/m.24431 type:complete len:218 (-) Transcript_18817:517-1170(-)